MISGFYTCTKWNLCRRYGFTLHSHNLVLTTFVQRDFRVLHLHNLKSLYLMGKWHISSYTHTYWFSLHSQNMISVAFSFLLCVCFLTYTYFVLIFMSKLSRSRLFYDMKSNFYNVFILKCDSITSISKEHHMVGVIR